MAPRTHDDDELSLPEEAAAASLESHHHHHHGAVGHQNTVVVMKSGQRRGGAGGGASSGRGLGAALLFCSAAGVGGLLAMPRAAVACEAPNTTDAAVILSTDAADGAAPVESPIVVAREEEHCANAMTAEAEVTASASASSGAVTAPAPVELETGAAAMELPNAAPMEGPQVSVYIAA